MAVNEGSECIYLYFMMMDMDRVIGRFTGSERGPLLIVLGGIHGNEPAGVSAISLIFKMLEVEPITNPEFSFRGRLVGLRGNLEALGEKRRYLRQDLNRMFTADRIEAARAKAGQDRGPEEGELLDLVGHIEDELSNYEPEELVVVDLHTTTARGGIFSIVGDDERSISIAVEMHAPVVLGMLQGLEGTTLHLVRHLRERGWNATGVCFEAGQHDDYLSVNRAIAAVINCMRTIGCVKREHVENQHDKLLIEFGADLPKVTRLIYKHRIEEGDGFTMLGNFNNFQYINKGEYLAKDKRGDIRAPHEGLILMPLYQAQGEEGFFIVEANE